MSQISKEHPINGMTDGPILRHLLMFFFPIMLGTFFQQLYNTADAIIVGRFVGKEALAAVGSTGNMINLLIGFFVGISSGATVIISQHYGAKEPSEVSKAVHTAITFSLAGGLLLTVIGYLTAYDFLRLMQSPDDVIDLAASYVKIFYLGTIPNLLYNMGSGILRAIGDSRRPLIYLIVCCFINIVLDLLFVAALGLGVTGACLATVLSLTVSAILVLAALIRSKESYRYIPRNTRIHAVPLKRIIHIGVPAGFQSAMYSIANIIIQTGINRLGTNAMAAYSAFGKLDSFYWMMINALGVSITTFAAQNFGARKLNRVYKGMHCAYALGSAISVFILVLMLPFGRTFISMFTKDEEVIELGVSLVRWIMPFLIFYVPVDVLSGSLRAIGDSWPGMVITGIGICVFRVLWILFVLPSHNTLVFASLCFPISWAITSLAFAIYYYFFSILGRKHSIPAGS